MQNDYLAMMYFKRNKKIIDSEHSHFFKVTVY